MAFVSTREYLTAKALRLLSYRPRSVAEIKLRLRKTNTDSKTINAVIAELEEQGLLNDQDFAAWWVDQRVNFRPRGNFALKQELKQKGISESIISSVLLTFEAELKLAKKLPPAQLARRGFSFTIIDALSHSE
ncbi:MAG: RecX family transcriptional regulator [Candidatus Beckwithbacteria bacterium]